MTRSYISVLALSLAAFASTQALADTTVAKTREQVQAELAAATRSGDIVEAWSGKKLNEVNPALYAKAAVGAPKTREQVKAELAEAVRNGDIAANDYSGQKANEVAPLAYPSKPVAQGKTREQVKAELAEAKRTGTMPVVGDA